MTVKARAYTFLAGLLCVAPVAFPQSSTEPVVGVDDPESLFVDTDPVLHRSKQLALHFMRELLQCNQWDKADQWLSERYLQHNPNGASGRDGIVRFFTRTRQRIDDCGRLETPIVAVLADDDLVTVVMPRVYDHPDRPGETYTSTWFYMWRVVDGRLDEHWSPSQLAARSSPR